MGLREGISVGLDGLLVKVGLVEEGLFVGLRLGLVGLPVDGRLDGAVEVLVSFFVTIPYEYSGIIECKHINKYIAHVRLLSTTSIHNLHDYFPPYMSSLLMIKHKQQPVEQ
jgi:hypothetical protein